MIEASLQKASNSLSPQSPQPTHMQLSCTHTGQGLPWSGHVSLYVCCLQSRPTVQAEGCLGLPTAPLTPRCGHMCQLGWPGWVAQQRGGSQMKKRWRVNGPISQHWQLTVWVFPRAEKGRGHIQIKPEFVASWLKKGADIPHLLTIKSIHLNKWI